MNDGSSMIRLLKIMQRLRDPQTGCPWDREQTLESIVPHTLEEAYEVAEAIHQGNSQALRDELGDLLFQVVFMSALAEEAGWFDFNAVAAGIADKLERRHPHVFGSADIPSAEAQTQAWESIKAAERSAQGAAGTLAGVARALPALTRASKLGKRAGRVGFDWPTAEGVRAKVTEELAELDEALAQNEALARQQEELGDALFALANWARRLGLDPEAALRAGNQKFETRFARMETLAFAEQRPLEQLNLDEWEALWQRAKAEELNDGRTLADKPP
jgi:ATP diphosphatase